MAIKGVLYTYPDNFRAFKALIAAKYSGAQVTLADNFVLGETNASPSFLSKFPNGKVPAFEDSDSGLCLYESDAIAYYLADEELRGGGQDGDPSKRALVQQWMSFASSELLPAASSWVFASLGALNQPKNITERARTDLIKGLELLNNHLLHSTYLVGERLSLADVCVACTLLLPFAHVVDPAVRSGLGNVVRWFDTVVNQPNVAAVVGKVTLCEKAPEISAPGHGHGHGGHGHKGGGKHPQKGKGGGGDKREEKKAAAAPPKKEEPAAAAAAPPPAAAASGEDGPAPAAKPKDPLSELPKGTFDMDDFKRFYSNNDEEKSVPYFWEKFDPAHYSIWRCDYKYEDELTMVFMSCNLIGGMFQRLEKMRKHAFASVCLFGENNNSSISGVWVWRGHDLAFELSEDWKIDYASYDWKKLDPSDGETKKLVDQYFKWTGEDAKGRKFNQGKIFK